MCVYISITRFSITDHSKGSDPPWHWHSKCNYRLYCRKRHQQCCRWCFQPQCFYKVFLWPSIFNIHFLEIMFFSLSFFVPSSFTIHFAILLRNFLFKLATILDFSSSCRKFKEADVPTSLIKSVPDFCSVYVISKGKTQTVRAATQALKPKIDALSTR